MTSVNVNAAKSKIKHMQAGSAKIKSAHVYQGGAFHKVWSGASVATYYDGARVVTTLDVDEGIDALLLAPTVAKSGYTHVGWAKTNGGDPIAHLYATGEPISLYAIWLPNTLTVLSATVRTIPGTVNPEYVINSYDSAYIANVQYAHAVGSYSYLYSSSDTKSMRIDIGLYQSMTVRGRGQGWGATSASINGTNCLDVDFAKSYTTSTTIEMKASGAHEDSGSWHSVICGCTSVILSNPKAWKYKA